MLGVMPAEFATNKDGSITVSVTFTPADSMLESDTRLQQAINDLRNSAQGDFEPNDILYASEIGLVVDDVPQTQREVKDSLGLEGFRGSYRSQSFSPVGDAHALLILVKRNRLWFPNKKQAAKVHPVQAAIHGPEVGELHNAALDDKVNLSPGKP